MPGIDLTKLGTEELQAILANDLTKVSTGTLRSMFGEEKAKPVPQMPGEDSGGFLQRLNESIVKRGSNVADVLTPKTDESLSQTLIKAPGRTLDIVGQAAGLIGDVGGDALASIVSGVTPNPVKEFAKEQVLRVLDTPIGKKGLSAIKQGMDSYALFKKENPEIAKHIEAGINIAGVIPFGRGAKVGVGAVDDLTKAVVTDIAKVEKPGFFSKLEEVVRTKVGNKVDAKQLKATLKNNGVTDAEIESTLHNIGEWNVVNPDGSIGFTGPKSEAEKVITHWGDKDLKLQPNVLTKQDVLDEIATNKTEFQDVILDDAHLTPTQRVDRIDNPTDYDITDRSTKFAQYQEPGAVEGSYREMFVTAPGKEKGQLPTWEQYKKFYSDPNNPLSKERGFVPDVEELQDAFDFDLAHRDFDTRFLEKIGIDPNKQSIGQWADGHSDYADIDNPIVRIRFNDRDVDGKRILFVEEMQGPAKLEQEKMPEALQKRIYDIGTKRVLSYAKENGYDGVAWTPGKLQADRYSLSKKLQQVEVTSTKSGKDGYTVDAMDYNGNIVIRNHKVANADELANTIGKDLAKKAVEKIDENNYNAIFQGLDLDVGGEGLKKLYDRDLPTIFKKHGKENVQQIEMLQKTGGQRLRPDIDEEDHGIFKTLDNLTRRPSIDTHDRFVLNQVFNHYSHGDSSLSSEQVEVLKRLAPELLNVSEKPMSVHYVPITDKVPNRYPMYGGAIGVGLAEGQEGESK